MNLMTRPEYFGLTRWAPELTRPVRSSIQVVLMVPDSMQLPFFPLDGIFSLGKYRAIYYYFEMRRNIIIILLSEGTKYYYFIEKEDNMLLEGEILLFEMTKYCYF